MFEINFYTLNDEPNKIGKNNNTFIETISGTLKEECSLQDPIIIIEKDTVPIANYMYIPSFNRYYFITKIESVRNNLWRISSHVDVLESFKSNIINNTATLSRQEHEYNLYLNDPLLKTRETFSVDLRIGEKQFSELSNVLIVGGITRD